ncbi:alpha/beta hydrolase [Actinoallomurus acaciae]|uniref:Alpha/beta hydrolase n=1 Tax=Actinoallomurus acaciae TaxID=502577 RepID=A0ABV5YHS5_9ACTN
MDAELAAIAKELPYEPLTDPEAARQRMRELVARLRVPVDPRVDVADRAVAGVPVRVYRPRHAGRVPVLVYFHGGGYVVGGVDNEDARCQTFAAEAGVEVVSVEYRLAPEHPFPAGFDDGYAVVEAVAERAPRLAVGGGSAGGGMAAAVALRARDEGGPPIAFQLLVYPMLDDRMDTPSARAYVDPPLLNRADVARMWEYYLGADRGEVSPYAAPARATDLRGLPPAYVLACEADPFRDEDIAYAHRLILAGVPAELHHLPGTYHGFDGFAAAVSRRAFAAQVDAVRRALT